MNASPAMDTGGAARLLRRRRSTLRSGSATRRVARRRTCGRARPHHRATADELLVADRRCPRPAAGTGSAYLRLEYRRQMEIAVVGAAAVVTLDGDGAVTDARVAITALAPRSAGSPEAEAALVGTDGGAGAARPRPQRPRRPRAPI